MKNDQTLGHFDFIEIGTCDYQTLLQQRGDTKRGISVEPIKIYLDLLPNKPNVIKVNAAISSKDGEIDLFYISPENQIKYNKKCTRGWGSVDRPHKGYSDPQELLNSGILTKSKTKSLTFKTLCETHNVKSVNWVKIDAEGHDCIIVDSILNYPKIKPRKISFEHSHCNKDQLQKTKQNLQNAGYQLSNEKCSKEDLIYCKQ